MKAFNQLRSENRRASRVPVLASSYIRHFRELITETTALLCVLWIRVSGREQLRQKNLKAQEASLVKKVQASGGQVIRVFSGVVSGWSDDRLEFEAACEYAFKHDAILVSESACRYLRSIHYNSETNPAVLPTKHEWESLLTVTKGVVMASILHPDRDWKSVRSYQTKRGIIEKEAKPGRPRKHEPGELKDRRIRLRPLVRRQRRKFRLTYGCLSDGHGIARMTIRDWVV